MIHQLLLFTIHAKLKSKWNPLSVYLINGNFILNSTLCVFNCISNYYFFYLCYLCYLEFEIEEYSHFTILICECFQANFKNVYSYSNSFDKNDKNNKNKNNIGFVLPR